MSKIVWDETGKRFWETGIKNGVLYPMNDDGSYAKGVAWNGLISISENPDGADPNELWADNIKYAVLRSAETLGLSIEAYTYPEEFEACDGLAKLDDAPGLLIGQQERKSFGLCYRTEVGNDTGSKKDDSYKLHIVYGCTAQPSDKDYETINDNPDAITFTWEVDTLPAPFTTAGLDPVSEIVVDSRRATTAGLKALEDALYGGESSEPRLPKPDEVIALLKTAA